MKTASAQKIVDSTLESIKKRVPAYSELADRFGPLFLTKGKVRDDLLDKLPDPPAVDTARLVAGVPLLIDEDLSLWVEAMEASRDELLPEVIEVLRLEADAAKALQGHLADPVNLVGLAQARIEGNWKHFENTSVQLGIGHSPSLLYISETVFGPVLCAMVDGMGKSLSDITWDRGYCPVCGSSPSISYLSPKEVSDLDHLVGGGGKKYLHCSLCGHDWRYRRNACVACGNDENDSREIFYVDDIRYERIEACHKCGKYCLNVDLREFEPHPHLDVVQMGLIHLDIFARNNELVPVTPTLWNAAD
ncbi:formate dehydrogenase accessory protein FdhE [Pseudodesulfovibrio portus]|uniref:Formate dehydrogenase formation protein FdhE n=1 Tax=Pseudodesulfovibrio portus TaxID=231439 RepID=A0ABM8AQB1_9BACT|nr:formate dehydrogenase accessory protein FdhE [Pseudodesulfovibrio portus]BDQ33496.1 formate dehydrogenase formation protein FdhE [Pseudodesulfovibrio portus]